MLLMRMANLQKKNSWSHGQTLQEVSYFQSNFSLHHCLYQNRLEFLFGQNEVGLDWNKVPLMQHYTI